MSEDAVDLLRDMYAAFNRGDWEAFLENMDPDVRWHEPEVISGPTEFRGRQELRAYLDKVTTVWEGFRVDPEDFVVVGDRVVVPVRASGRGRSSGIEVDKRFVELWTVCEGTLLDREYYPDKASALRALGHAE